MSVTETQTKTESGVIVVPELATRYRLAEAQLSVLPPVDEDDAEEWSGLRFQCEEVMELIERISRAEERERVLRGAANEFRDAVLNQRGQFEEPCLDNDQTNAVLGAFDDTIGAALTAAPERPAPKPWGFSGYLEVLPDKPSCPGCQQIGATLFLTDDNLTLCKQCIDSSNEDMGSAPEQGKEPTA